MSFANKIVNIEINLPFIYMQIVVWRFLQRSKGSDVYVTKQALLVIVFLQYIPRFLRAFPLASELKRTTGVFAETAWAGAAYYLLLYMLASHVSSSFSFLRILHFILFINFVASSIQKGQAAQFWLSR